MAANRARLTGLAACAGCAAKTGAEDLSRVVEYLDGLQAGQPLGLPAGLAAPDDATVYKLSDEQAVVLIVDFFAPPVDDPYQYGALSAANAVSDIYAMGGEVTLALNVAAFPDDLGTEVIAGILRGGAEKVAEAGAVIAGGHTIIDSKPKYGLCFVGLVHPDRIFTKAGGQPGDRLYLTKLLGTGIITTAAKFEEAEPDHLDAAIAIMTRLNCCASSVVRNVGAHAMTDITGFGILGHGYEMAAASEVEVRFSAGAIPILPGGLEYAYRGIMTGGAVRNRQYLLGKVSISQEVSKELAHVLYDPQTSGGLLFSVPEDRASATESHFADDGLPIWRVGEIAGGQGVTVVP